MNTDKIDLIYEILERTVYSYEMYRQLIPYFKDKEAVFDPIEREFWCHVSDNSIQMVAVQWNKVFGSNFRGNNDNTHFTNLIPEEEFNFRLMEKGIDFQSTIQDMKVFRDKYVAHKDKEEFAVPYFYRPIKIIHEFDLMVRERYEEIKQRYYCDLIGMHNAYHLRVKDYLIQKGILLQNDIEESDIENGL